MSEDEVRIGGKCHRYQQAIPPFLMTCRDRSGDQWKSHGGMLF